MNVRIAVRDMEAYAWEASSESIANSFGLDSENVIRFDTNTSPFVLERVRVASRELDGLPFNEYPAPDYGKLVEGIRRYLQVDAEQVVVGAGADEVIDTIAKAVLESGTKSVISTPTYSMFRVSSQTYGAQVVQMPRGAGFTLDTEALADAAKDAALLWVCNPNSPTGNAEPVSEIRALLESTKACVVVDEAYAEFGGESSVALLKDFENLVVIRTLSKAFGMAGARVGYAATNPALARELNKLRLPNSIGAASCKLAEAALSPDGIGQMRQNVAAIVKERERMQAALRARFRAFASQANFLLLECKDADAQTVFESLLAQGLMVRNVGKNPLTRNCLRMTVRSPAENDRLLEALR